MGFIDRLQHAWNAFVENDLSRGRRDYVNLGYSTSFRPDRLFLSRGNEKSIVNAIYNRIALDCASIIIRHVRLDDNGRFINEVPSGLNNCLSVEANKDQSAIAFMQDIVISMFDEGVVAIVPVDTSINAVESNSYDILSLRTGRITQWYPDHVRIDVYNDQKGMREEITVPKKIVAIVENPLYSVMNQKNSMLQRLVQKLNLLDAIDQQSGSGKLDLIIQLPYVIKTDERRKQADLRRADIESQLSGSKYGVAYTDGTEKVTQLNRPVENNLLKQVEFLTSMSYGQLGITPSVMDGTADEKTMLNYLNRTIEPVVAAIAQEMNRKFLTKTARSQKQTIKYFNNQFKLVPLGNLAEIVDKFTRNEVLSPNEIRQIIGMKPASDPKADELRNRNINANGQMIEYTEEGEAGHSGLPRVIESSDKGRKKFKIKLINQGGHEVEFLVLAKDEEDAVKAAIDGTDVPRENIKLVEAI